MTTLRTGFLLAAGLMVMAVGGARTGAAASGPSGPTTLSVPAGPSLNSPKCVRVPEARGEEAGDEELGVGRNGEYCAYPVRMMTYHRIVNDHLGGPPILVAYDPDTASGRVYDPVLEGKPYTFDAQPAQGGLPVLKDRETGSMWSSLTGEALAGPLAGKRLGRLRSMILTWGRWKALHADSWVLAEDSHLSPHYVARTAAATCPVPTTSTGATPKKDSRLPADTLVLGIAGDGIAAALALTDKHGGYASSAGVREATVGKDSVAVFLDPAAHAGVAYVPTANGRSLHFRTASGTVLPAWTDRETGSTWNLEGVCTGGALKGVSLTPADAVRVRWYAWSVLHPGSAVLRSR